MKIPSTHQAVMPYLILNDAPAFIEFTKQVFTIQSLFTKYREDDKTIMHGEIRINGCTIMFADSTENYPAANANLFIYVENADDTFAKALKNGATIINDLADMEYGRSGGIKDPFGNIWWITANIKST
ncbi:MAG: VOC family protein [Ferruginibacter sp.]